MGKVEVSYLLSYEGEGLEKLGPIDKPGYITDSGKFVSV
jgi:hypothetical protein